MPSLAAAAPVPDRRASARAAARACPMVDADRVSHRYGRLVALDDITLHVDAGEILCLLGPSGSGKSTLLRLVAGIDRPWAGAIRLDGRAVAAPGVFVEPEARHVGMVFQDFALFPHLNVAGNVAFGLKGRSRADVERTVAGLLERVGLSRYASSYPHMLSGGERQRVALARALAPEPRVLLMDEPFSSLDGQLRDQVRQDTVRLLRDLHTTTIVVTHDSGEAVRIADRIALLRRGRLLQCGSPEELYASPSSAFAARLFGDVNQLSGSCRGGRVDTPFGSVPAPGLGEHAAARVCIRPQHLRLAAGPAGVRGRVVTSEFLGEARRITVAADGLAPLVVHLAAAGQVAPGDRVFLDVHPSDVIVVPDDDDSSVQD